MKIMKIMRERGGRIKNNNSPLWLPAGCACENEERVKKQTMKTETETETDNVNFNPQKDKEKSLRIDKQRDK